MGDGLGSSSKILERKEAISLQKGKVIDWRAWLWSYWGFYYVWESRNEHLNTYSS